MKVLRGNAGCPFNYVKCNNLHNNLIKFKKEQLLLVRN